MKEVLCEREGGLKEALCVREGFSVGDSFFLLLCRVFLTWRALIGVA